MYTRMQKALGFLFLLDVGIIGTINTDQCGRPAAEKMY